MITMTYLLGEILDAWENTQLNNGKKIIEKWLYILDISPQELQETIIDTAVLNIIQHNDKINFFTISDMEKAVEICITKRYMGLIQSNEEVFKRLFSGTFGND
jgi:hypothetical protein